MLTRDLEVIIAPRDMRVPAAGICPDPVFNARAASGLVWLPELGMGYLPVTEAPYDADYFAKYQAYADTDMGAAITEARRELVMRHANELHSLCDVGIGCGDFLDTIRFYMPNAGGCDINPAGVQWLNERGLFVDPYYDACDVLTFWDSIEHIPDVHRMLSRAKRWVFCSLPIVPGDGPPRTDWKHLRRDEHCWYFTRRGFIAWMAAQGFECVECSAAESLLGREDIESFAFKRRAC